MESPTVSKAVRDEMANQRAMDLYARIAYVLDAFYKLYFRAEVPRFARDYESWSESSKSNKPALLDCSWSKPKEIATFRDSRISLELGLSSVFMSQQKLSVLFDAMALRNATELVR